MQEKELKQIVALKMAMFRDTHLGLQFRPDVEEYIFKDYQSLYEKDDIRHFTKSENGTLVAMAGAFIKHDHPFCYLDPPYYGYIGDVYVHPDYRKRGWATQLSRLCIDWLKSKDVSVIRLLAASAARPIYEKLGFQPSDEMVLRFKGPSKLCR